MAWYMWLIAAGVLVALGGLTYLFFRFAKGGVGSTVVTVVGSLAESVAALLPDDATKLDAHDVVLAVGRLAKKMPEWANNPANATFLDCKDDILLFLEEQRSLVPPLAALPKDTLEKAAEVLFTLAKVLPAAFGA